MEDFDFHNLTSFVSFIAVTFNVFFFFTQIGSRSSVYSHASRLRKTGSYVYEDFMPTDGTDVKVSEIIYQYCSPSLSNSQT